MRMSDGQKKIGFIAFITVMQLVFLQAIPYGKSIDFFLLSDAKCTIQEYIYYLCEHLAFVYLYYFMFMEIKSVRRQLSFFFSMSVFDFFDYLLTYNSVWFRVLDVSISFNVIQVLFVCWIVWDAKNE
jgi:hypothetical protein